MSIEIIYDISFINENGELKKQEEILLEYFNNLVKECRKQTKGKDYDTIENGEPMNRFQNRLGFFEDELDYTISKMEIEISYKKHKKLLNELYDTKCLYEWNYTENPMTDLNNYVKCLRKKVKAFIKIYNQHDLKENLISGYEYYTH